MYRARFHANEEDYRPVVWPVPHPYWCTGYGPGCSVVVAYVDDKDQLLRQWPEATNIEMEPSEEYFFSDRFPRPEWLELPPER